MATGGANVQTLRKDWVAALGWVLAVIWGAGTYLAAADLRTSNASTNDLARSTWGVVSGSVLFVIAAVLSVAAVGRSMRGGERWQLPVVSRWLGWVLIALFVVFVFWGISLTTKADLAEVLIVQLPYLVSGFSVLFGAHPTIL